MNNDPHPVGVVEEHHFATKEASAFRGQLTCDVFRTQLAMGPKVKANIFITRATYRCSVDVYNTHAHNGNVLAIVAFSFQKRTLTVRRSMYYKEWKVPSKK